LQVQYLFAIVVGLVGGLAMQLGYWRQPYVRGLHKNKAGLDKAPLGQPVGGG